MRIFKRKFVAREVPAKLLMMTFLFCRTVVLFKRPLRLVYFYITSKPLPERSVEFRNGHKIILSNCPFDLVTVLVILCKQEYGDIPVGGIIIDIGANIGIFSLYAMFNGAAKVLAFEPNLEAFEILKRNVKENCLEDCVTTHNVAVGGKDNETVRIPVGSNPNNVVYTIAGGGSDDTVAIKTISLHGIFQSNTLNNVDLIKMDCEGAEYEIVEGANNGIYDKVKRIRFEYHNGAERLTNHLSKYRFKIDGFFPDNKRVGRIFYKK